MPSAPSAAPAGRRRRGSAECERPVRRQLLTPGDDCPLTPCDPGWLRLVRTCRLLRGLDRLPHVGLWIDPSGFDPQNVVDLLLDRRAEAAWMVDAADVIPSDPRKP